MSNCTLCGEPMPAGEEMFQFHGYSGPCPKPPLSKLMQKVVVEYALHKDRDGGWHFSIKIDRDQIRSLGPFPDEQSARAAFEDMMAMMRQLGAVDTVPQ